MKRWQKILLSTVAVAGVFYGMVYVDVIWRARESWLEGEKYWRWADHPKERAAFLEAQLTQNRALLDKKRAASQTTPEDYARDVELLEFSHQQALKESSIKYAYIWYQTAAELFSPPESKWVRLSREKMPLAKERWRAELRAQKIPFEEYMLD